MVRGNDSMFVIATPSEPVSNVFQLLRLFWDATKVIVVPRDAPAATEMEHCNCSHEYSP
jgi:hypothetical protein